MSLWPRVAIVVIVVAIGLACQPPGGFKSPPPCDPAIACVQIVQESNSRCDTGPVGDSRVIYRVQNNSMDRRVYVTYKVRTDHINSPGVPSVEEEGMRSVDRNGRTDIDCKYSRMGEQNWDLHSYRVSSACFEFDPLCDPSLVASGPAASACDTACIGPDCIRRHSSGADPLSGKLLRRLRCKRTEYSLIHLPHPST